MAGLLFVVVGVVYASTAEWDDSAVNVDAVAAALPAWSLAQRGTIDLADLSPANPWLVEVEGRLYSNRPPGVYLPAVPAYLMTRSDSFSTDPATATAVVVTAAAVAVLFLTLASVVPHTTALAAAIVFAFGTATWPISSTQLWPHGVGQLTAAIAMWGIARRERLVPGLALGWGVLTRPPTAVFAAVLGLQAISKRRSRDWRAFLTFGLLASAGLAALIVYNAHVFGEASISGGYDAGFRESLTNMGVVEYLLNLARLFFLLPNGVFVWTPIILVAAVATWGIRKEAPDWTSAGGLAAVLYLVLHARANRASGGLPFNYRYPLEPIVLAAPILSIAAFRWFQTGGWRRRAVVAAALFSLAMQLLYVLSFECAPLNDSEVLCSFSF